MMAPSLNAPNTAMPGRPGPITRALLALVALSLAVLAFVIAIPLLIGVVIVGAVWITVVRWRLRKRVESELTHGRENVRVIRRDIN